jgi:hypothetical protein
MKLIRRIHLYLGLFLVPWVLLYGITGILLNHPSLLSGIDERNANPGELKNILAPDFPTPLEAARQIIDTLNKNPDIGNGSFTLVNENKARYINGLDINFTDNKIRYDLAVNPGSDQGTIRLIPEKSQPESPLGNLKQLAIFDSTREKIKDGALKIIGRPELTKEQLGWFWGPQIEFEMQARGKIWKVQYNYGRRDIQAKPQAGLLATNGVREFLIRMHRTHAYPQTFDSRFFWALMVDLTGFFFITWAITGILMWWQMRAVRFYGSVIVATSIVWAVMLTIMMYYLFKQ